FKHQVVEKSLDDAGLVHGRRKVASYRGIGGEQEVVVRTAVIRILLFLLKHSDDGVGHALDRKRGADCRLPGVELPAGRMSENDDSPSMALVIVGNKASLTEQQRPEILIRRPHSDHPAAGGIEFAYLRDGAPQLRAHVLDEIAFISNQPRVVN